ncbi:MAG: hypothetical protein ACTS73_07795 [Arsenophonus sp. NEOnobi-MAG3]
MNDFNNREICHKKVYLRGKVSAKSDITYDPLHEPICNAGSKLIGNAVEGR